MSWLKEKAWPWIKKWGVFILAIIVAVLTLGMVRIQYKKKLGEVRDELAIVKGTAEVKRLRAVRAEVAARVGEKDEAIKHIDQQLEANKKEIVRAYEGSEDMTDKEMLDAFKDLGI